MRSDRMLHQLRIAGGCLVNGPKCRTHAAFRGVAHAPVSTPILLDPHIRCKECPFCGVEWVETVSLAGCLPARDTHGSSKMHFTKGGPPVTLMPVAIPDSLAAWIRHYTQFAITGVRSPAVAQKIALHLDRFRAFFAQTYGHD